jgi:hypothetical protein
MSAKACPITREEFRQSAQAVAVTINSAAMNADVKEFATGSLGWFLSGKTTLKVGDKLVNVQVGLNLTVIGSKELPK